MRLPPPSSSLGLCRIPPSRRNSSPTSSVCLRAQSVLSLNVASDWYGLDKTENERLPSELGWTKKEAQVTLTDITSVANVLRNATSLFTGAATPHKIRRDLHAAF